MSLQGADTEWIEDFLMLQSYMRDCEHGQEPSLLVRTYMAQHGEPLVSAARDR